MAFNFLAVDDSVVIRMMLKKTLKASGVPFRNIFEAENGKKALELLEEEWIDLVFVDINMPVMDGITMIDRMHEKNLLDTIPTVVVSTEGSQTKIDSLWNKGISAFVGKPFTPERIRSIVSDILGEWEPLVTSDEEDDDLSF